MCGRGFNVNKTMHSRVRWVWAASAVMLSSVSLWCAVWSTEGCVTLEVVESPFRVTYRALPSDQIKC